MLTLEDKKNIQENLTLELFRWSINAIGCVFLYVNIVGEIYLMAWVFIEPLVVVGDYLMQFQTTLRFKNVTVRCRHFLGSGVDTSSHLPLVETHCLQVLTLPSICVDTWSSIFKEFSYYPQVSTLPLSGVDNFCLFLWNLATDPVCWQFLHKMSTLLVYHF